MCVFVCLSECVIPPADNLFGCDAFCSIASLQGATVGRHKELLLNVVEGLRTLAGTLQCIAGTSHNGNLPDS